MGERPIIERVRWMRDGDRGVAGQVRPVGPHLQLQTGDQYDWVDNDQEREDAVGSTDCSTTVPSLSSFA